MLFVVSGLAAILLIIFINTLMFGRLEKSAVYIPEAAGTAEIDRLAEAIRIRTVSHYDHSKDDLEAFSAFQRFLEQKFPLFHNAAERDVLSEYAVVYRWPGTDSSLPPVMLTAHYDVVPADPGKWSVPPFDGLVKDGYLWGRGTLDTKNTLMACMESVERLCREGFAPQRTVYFAFGGDEEIIGELGAKTIAKWFIDKGIHFDWLWDEGAITGDGLMPGIVKKISLIGTAEKGQINVLLSTRSEGGGHAAMPPRYTATGRIARAVARIEARPFPLRWIGTTRIFFRKMARAGGPAFKIALSNLWITGGLLKIILGSNPGSAAMFRTTAAPTMIKGSSKENVLADTATAVINVRILPGDNIEMVLNRIRKIVNDDRVEIRLLNENEADEPTTESSVKSEGYRLLESMLLQTVPDAVVLPYLSTTASDARNYSECCDNLYRYAPMILNQEELDRIHGVDERISFENYGLAMKCYRTLIKKL